MKDLLVIPVYDESGGSIPTIEVDDIFIAPSLARLFKTVGVIGTVVSLIASKELMSEKWRNLICSEYGYDDYRIGLFLIVGLGLLSTTLATWGYVGGPRKTYTTDEEVVNGVVIE